MIMISDLLAAGRPGHAGPGHRDGDLSLRELVAAGNLKLNMNAFFQVSPGRAGNRDWLLKLRLPAHGPGNLKLNLNAFFQVSPHWKLAANAVGTWARSRRHRTRT